MRSTHPGEYAMPGQRLVQGGESFGQPCRVSAQQGMDAPAGLDGLGFVFAQVRKGWPSQEQLLGSRSTVLERRRKEGTVWCTEGGESHKA
eukprot:1159941-Pelagomonas_calceolata.AAC.3